MGGAAVLAAALTDHSARYAILTIAGNDLLLEPTGTSGNRYGIPVESIQHIERGPGAVSELTFTLLDPLATVTLTQNDPVYFSKTAESTPIFQGFVTSWTPAPMGSSGRMFEVRCAGLEIVLDWAKCAALTFPAGMLDVAAVQVAVASCLNGLAFPLNAASGSGVAGSYLKPVGGDSGSLVTGGVTISAGTTLREAIRTILDNSILPYTGGVPRATLTSVDSMGGLRVWPSSKLLDNQVMAAGGMAELFVVDAQTSPADGDGTVGSPMVAEQVAWQNDATLPVAVYVIGSGGVTALVNQTGGDGDLAVIIDSSLTTVEQCQSAAIAYLGRNREQRRGFFRLPNKVPQPTFRAGSTVTFTDAQVGASGTKYRVTEIRRRFHGTLEDWDVTLGGGGRSSYVADARHLTRGILS